MTNISVPIVFFGTEEFSLGALQALIDAGYPVAVVVTKPDSPQGRGHHVTPPPVKILASKYNIPVWQPNKLHDISDDIKQLNAPLGVLVSYGKIIPQAIIDLFTPGIINVHPSLLPRYRGPSPIESAILNGDMTTGVSIMSLSAKMDAGPVYQQKVIQLTQAETSEELYETLGKIGSQMLVDILPDIATGTLQPHAQNEADATYCQLIKKTDGIIDWSQSAADIECKVRAYHEWPQSRTTLGSVDVIITKTHTVAAFETQPGRIKIENDSLYVQTATDAVAIDMIKPLGKKEMPIQAFLSGYTSQLLG